MSKNQQLVKLALVFYANCQIQLELLDELRGTSLFKQRYKSLVKSITTETEQYIAHIYAHLDDEQTELQFHQVAALNDAFLEAIKCREVNDMATLKELLTEYTNGSIGILPENKHKKIFSQLEKI
jgi:hypothetical protein